MELLGAPLKDPVPPVETLVVRARGGDQPAFARLIRDHERDAMAAAIGILKDRRQAEEAVQEAFCRAWEALDSIREPARFKGWFTAILTRICRDVQRSGSRDRRVLPLLRPASAAGEAAPLPPVVEEALELPDEYREPLVLFYLQELSLAELAEALGMTEENAKVRLHRGRKMLRERLERKGYRGQRGRP